jgi:hypothetical protein
MAEEKIAKVQLCPDGAAGQRMEAPIKHNALVYVDIGDREIGISFTPEGPFEIWVHDDVKNDGPRRFTYQPEPFVEEPSS